MKLWENAEKLPKKHEERTMKNFLPKALPQTNPKLSKRPQKKSLTLIQGALQLGFLKSDLNSQLQERGGAWVLCGEVIDSVVSTRRFLSRVHASSNTLTQLN